MNCFETRREFAAFWRRAMPSADRAWFVEHLKACAQCDRAFRTFALSAPVVHSGSQPDEAAAIRPPFDLVRPRRFATAGVEPCSRRAPERPWQIVAAAALLLIGVFGAWSSAEWPVRNFAETVAGDTADIDPAIYSSDGALIAPEATAQEPSLFDSVAPEPLASGNDGLAG
jgi:hypothetical protein